MKRIVTVLTLAAALLLAAFVLTHLGAYPQIMTTWWYGALATFVALNTIGFATYAALKLGYQSGRTARNAGHDADAAHIDEQTTADGRADLSNTAELMPVG